MLIHRDFFSQTNHYQCQQKSDSKQNYLTKLKTFFKPLSITTKI